MCMYVRITGSVSPGFGGRLGRFSWAVSYSYSNCKIYSKATMTSVRARALALARAWVRAQALALFRRERRFDARWPVQKGAAAHAAKSEKATPFSFADTFQDIIFSYPPISFSFPLPPAEVLKVREASGGLKQTERSLNDRNPWAVFFFTVSVTKERPR